ncbi:MAG: fibronectin type III domain-containing protein [Pseudobdellovibrionaceae bacterium]
MNTLALFLTSIALVSLSAFASGGEEQHEGTRKNDFYPNKPADKSLATRPAKATLLEPKAFSNVAPGTVTLKWQEAAGADSYRVQVATDPNFKWLVTQQDFVKATSLDVSNLEAGQQYFWRVYSMNPKNESGFTSSFASVSSFEVK